MSPLGPTADSDIERLTPCPDCDGTGLLHDYSSPDPQQHWNATCWRCRETGLIDIAEEAA